MTDKPPLPKLSKRQVEIALLVAEGLSNPAIAKRLRIDVETVKTCLVQTYAKMRARNRVHLVVICLKLKLIRLEEIPDPGAAGLASLSALEVEVLELICENLIAHQVATRLKVEAWTVWSAEARIRTKWNVGTRDELIALGRSYLHRHRGQNMLSDKEK